METLAEIRADQFRKILTNSRLPSIGSVDEPVLSRRRRLVNPSAASQSSKNLEARSSNTARRVRPNFFRNRCRNISCIPSIHPSVSPSVQTLSNSQPKLHSEHGCGFRIIRHRSDLLQSIRDLIRNSVKPYRNRQREAQSNSKTTTCQTDRAHIALI